MKVATIDGSIEVPEEEVYKTASISPFAFVNAINYTKEEMIVDDWSEKQYNPFIVNKSLSFAADTVIIANEMNSRAHIQKKMQFDFLCGVVRAKKRYSKWIKPGKLEDVSLIKEYYKYSSAKALEALKLLSQEQLQNIRDAMFTGGLNDDT